MSVAYLRYEPASWSWEEFNESIAAGWFDDPNIIPFLGPECGQIEIKKSPAAAVIHERVEEIARKLERPTERYLDQVVRARLSGKDESGRGLAARHDDDYYAFLIQVVQVGMSATRLFTSMISGGSAVVDWRRHEEHQQVRMSRRDLRKLVAHRPDGGGLDELFEESESSDRPSEFERTLATYVSALSEALTVAKQLRKRAERARTTREGRGTKQEEPALGESFDDHLWQLFGAGGVVSGLEAIEHSTIEETDDWTKITLRGEQVEWLTNLVWHTLRFDVALYPSADELAFQLSMTCWPPGRMDKQGLMAIAKPELSLATQSARHAETVATQLAWAMDRATGTDGQSHERSEFYETIAQIMLEHARRFRQVPEPGNAAHHGFQPVVFSSSFDWEIETQLLVHASGPREKVTVIVPVIVVPNNSVAASLHWVHATIGPQANEADARRALASPAWEWVPMPTSTDGVAPDWPVDEGVSVVKVNGSPLHYRLGGSRIRDHERLRDGLDDPDIGFAASWAGDINEHSALRHAIVLSEFELLRTVSLEIQKVGPDFLEALSVSSPKTPHIRDRRRRLIFIGHPITDWITRVRVLNRFFTSRTDFGGSQSTANVLDTGAAGGLNSYLVGQEMDLMRASLLSWADVKPVDVSMKNLVKALHTYSETYRLRVAPS